MTNDTTFDKIEAWLSGELLEAEARAFEAELATDTALAAEVARHRRGRDALDRLAEQALQTDIISWRESLDDLPAPPADARPAPVASNRSPWIFGVFFLILLVGAAYWFWPSEESQLENPTIQETTPTQTKIDVPVVVTPQKELPEEPILRNFESRNPKPELKKTKQFAGLVQKYYKAPSFSSLRGGTSTDQPSEDLVEHAIQLFEQGNTKEAFLLLEPDSIILSDEFALYLRGNINFNLKEYNAAAKDFRQLENSFQYRHEAKWYWLLSQAANGSWFRPETQELLQKVKKDPGFPFQVNLKQLTEEIGVN